MKILKFYTDTCMPCKVVGKILDKIEGLVVVSINAIENTEEKDKWQVQSTPTLIFLKDGKEVGRITGMTTEKKIREYLE